MRARSPRWARWPWGRVGVGAGAAVGARALVAPPRDSVRGPRRVAAKAPAVPQEARQAEGVVGFARRARLGACGEEDGRDGRGSGGRGHRGPGAVVAPVARGVDGVTRVGGGLSGPAAGGAARKALVDPDIKGAPGHKAPQARREGRVGGHHGPPGAG